MKKLFLFFLISSSCFAQQLTDRDLMYSTFWGVDNTRIDCISHDKFMELSKKPHPMEFIDHVDKGGCNIKNSIAYCPNKTAEKVLLDMWKPTAFKGIVTLKEN